MKYDLCVGFSNRESEALSKELDRDESAWAKAIGVFERRMRERFFSSIDALITADTKPDSQPSHPDTGHCIPGFSIMALCCLLIETLQGFPESAPARPIPRDHVLFRRTLHQAAVWFKSKVHYVPPSPGVRWGLQWKGCQKLRLGHQEWNYP